MSLRLFRASALALTTSLIVASAGLSGCSPSSSGAPGPLVSTRPQQAKPAALPSAWQAWIDGMKAAGYSVVQGGAYIVDSNSCQLYLQVFGTCAGNNPASPYIAIQPPIVAGEYIDPYYATAFTQVSGYGVPMNEFNRIADNEALVVIVNMPPRAAYLGYQSYGYTRDKSNYSSVSQGSSTTPDPDRYITFGSLGNAVNNVIIQNNSGVTWQSGQVAMITTSNQNLDTALRSVLRSSTTLNGNRLISEAIGSEMFTGLGKTADEFFTIMRYALPEDKTAGDSWINNVLDNVWVFRVSDPSGAAVSRYATPDYTKKTAILDSSLADSLNELTQLLLGYAKNVEGQTSATTGPLRATVFYGTSSTLQGQVGQLCIAGALNCAGDNQDTDAYRIRSIGKLLDGNTAFVAGVNQTLFPSALIANATYVSVGVYDANTLTGVEDLSQVNAAAAGFSSGVLNGSAQQALQDLGLYTQASATLKNQLPYFYVAGIARKCPVNSDWCLNIGTDKIPASHGIVLSQRAYVRPGTTTGANPDYLRPPQAVFLGTAP